MRKEYKYHYVYRITNIVTGHHYYGSKSCNEYPTENIGKKYHSSSTNKFFIQDQKNNPQDYKYKVLKIFETIREDATELEVKLHSKFDVKNHPKFINKANQTSKKFDTTGMPSEKHHMYGKTHSNEAKEKIGAISRGTTTVKDKDGRIFRVDCDDPKVLSGELVGVNKGVKFSNETKMKQSLKRKGIMKSESHKRKISKANKGKIFSDTHKKQISKTKKEMTFIHNDVLKKDKNVKNNELVEYINEGWEIGKKYSIRIPTIKKINIYSDDHKLQYSSYGNFEEICIKFDLPLGSLRRTIKNKNTLYEKHPPKFKKYLKFKGWYAKVVD